MKKIIIWILVVAALIAAAYFVGDRRGYNRAMNGFEEKRDTVTVIKWRKDPKPSLISEITLPQLPYYVFFTVRDTVNGEQVVVKDSVAVGMVQREFGDSTYTAWVSGPQIGEYGPQLDSIEQAVPVKYITSYITPKVRPNSIFVDASAIYDKSPFLPLTVNYGYEKNGLMLYGGGGYDFLTKSPVVRVGFRWKPFTW